MTSALHFTRNLLVPAVCASVLLGGCASMTTPPPGGAMVQSTGFHEAIDLNGRLSVRYQQNGKDESMHGSFVWAQTREHTKVTLLSPLGQTMASIDVALGISTMAQVGQPPRTAADANTLAAETLGWPLPVAGLRDWLQGIVVDKSGRRITAQDANAGVITSSDGWRIHYVSWENDAPSHPKRIDLDRYTEQAGEVSIRIVIDAWQTH